MVLFNAFKTRFGSNNKGMLLVASLMVMVVILIVTGVYFSSLLTEKKSVDTEKLTAQTLNLAEAGANHAIAELKERIHIELEARARNISNASVFQAYISANDSLGFITNFTTVAGKNNFTISGNYANLTVSNLNLTTPLNLSPSANGGYNAKISVRANANPTGNVTAEIFNFSYNYTVNSTGFINSTTPVIQDEVRLLQGWVNITVRRDNFAKFALFTINHTTPSGTVVWFTSDTNFNGPVHTNERFSFANNLSGHFTEDVTQYNQTARFYNNSSSRNVLLNADSNPPYDVPVFDKSFRRGVGKLNLTTYVNETMLRGQSLGTWSAPSSNGIYIPCNNTTLDLTGGIYIRGNCSIGVDNTTGNNPYYTITRGTDTNYITVNYTANTTRVQNATNDTTYQGIPNGMTEQGVIIYARDNITSFSGMVQEDSNLTVSSSRNIIITNNVTYQQYNAGPPLNATGYDNVLGLISWNGNITIGRTAPDNVTIHGVVMAPEGVFTVDDYGNSTRGPRGIATLFGGAITEYYGAFGTFSGDTMRSGYGRNFVYDARMLSGKTPPYFPYMSNFTSSEQGLSNKLLWQD